MNNRDTNLNTELNFDVMVNDIHNFNNDLLTKIISNEKYNLSYKSMNIYWGTTPTGKLHIGYIIPLLQLLLFLKQGHKIKILIADTHSIIDKNGNPIELINNRSSYYEILLRITVKHLATLMGIEQSLIDTIEYVLGTSFQTSQEYIIDMLRAQSLVSYQDAKRAGKFVINNKLNPAMSNLIYPTMQALDEKYMNVDAQLGGEDQIEIFNHSIKLLPKLGFHKQRTYFINKMLPALRLSQKHDSTTKSNRMSSTQQYEFKIELLDINNKLLHKINNVYCAEKNYIDNSLLELIQLLLIPLFKSIGKQININNNVYKKFIDIQYDYAKNIITPNMLKSFVYNSLNELLTPIHNTFMDNNGSDILKLSYPKK